MPLAVARRRVARDAAGRPRARAGRSRTGAGARSGPRRRPLPPPATPERWTPAIVAAPLFGRADGAGAGRRDSRAALQGDTRLLGVFAERDGGGYALFRLADRGPVLVQAGQEIAKDVTLEIVRPDGVRIRDHGEVRDIALRATPAAAAPPARAPTARAPRRDRAACAPPPGYTGPVYRLNAELLTGIASQPDSWKALLVAGHRRARRARRQRVRDDARHEAPATG